MSTLIRHGRVVTPEGVKALDVRIESGRIAELLPAGAPAEACEVLDAAGCYVLPGFIDLHTHLDDRIGRFELADTYRSGSEVAIRNGITTLCSFVTQSDAPLSEAVAIARAKAEGRTHCDLTWHLTPTRFDAQGWRDIDALWERGFHTFKLYTTYRAAGIFCDHETMDAAFARLAPRGARFLVHCEDDAILQAVDPGGMDLSKASSHARLRPEEAEVEAIRRVLDLAQKRTARLHVVHVSTVGGAEAIRAAKCAMDLTCETCPQYLWLDEGVLARPDGHRWICSPPLRGHREAFRALALEGAFDAFATDHCAFLRHDKDDWKGMDIRTVANGLPGLGALPHLAWRLFEQDPDRAAQELARHLALEPARIAGLGDRKGAIRPGLDADLVLLDPHGTPRPVRSSLADAFEPYPGFTSPLEIRHVLLRGRPAVRNGELTAPGEPRGVCLCEA